MTHKSKPVGWLATAPNKIPQYFEEEKAAHMFCGDMTIIPVYAEPLDSPDKDTGEAIRNEALEDRLRFEKHFRGNGFTFKYHSDGGYVSGYGAEIWEGWQACSLLKSQPAQLSDSQAEVSDGALLDWLDTLDRISFAINGNSRETIKAAMRVDKEGK